LSAAVSSAYIDGWATGTFSNPLPYSLRMQTDGNLVIYDNNNYPIWATMTNQVGVSPRRLVLQNSGILAVVDATDSILWHN